jgi:hypothetical protein
MSISRRIHRLRFFREYKQILEDGAIKPDKSLVVEHGSIVRIDLYDVLDNKATSKLIKKISGLKKSDYKTKLYYKKSRLRTRNYIQPQFDHTATGLFAEITKLNDDFLREIHLSWTQINNDEAIIQYSFMLGKSVKSVEDCRKWVLDYWDLIRKVEALPYYGSVDVLAADTSQNNSYIYDLFLGIFQGFVNDNLHTNLGHTYRLPVNVLQLTKKSASLNKIINDNFIYSVYKKDKENTYILHNIVDKWQIDTIVIGDTYSGQDLLGYFSEYGMEYYYLAFGDIEIAELSRRLVGYFNKGRTKISYRNRKWLLRKFRRVSEVKLFPPRKGSGNIIAVTEKIAGEEYIRLGTANKFKEVYEDNLKYINSVFGLADAHIWAWVLLGISFLTLLATILSLAK